MRQERRGFTLLELMIVVSIICVLAGFLFAAATMAQKAAKIQRSTATIQVLAVACDQYWTLYHDYPYPNPDSVGVTPDTLGSIAAMKQKPYYNGGWTGDGYCVAFVWLMSAPRSPEPFLDLNQKWYVLAVDGSKNAILGPDQRKLFKCVDGWGNTIYVNRPSRYYYRDNYVKITSGGPDGKMGTLTAGAYDSATGSTAPDTWTGTDASDNIETFLKR